MKKFCMEGIKIFRKGLNYVIQDYFIIEEKGYNIESKSLVNLFNEKKQLFLFRYQNLDLIIYLIGGFEDCYLMLSFLRGDVYMKRIKGVRKIQIMFRVD